MRELSFFLSIAFGVLVMYLANKKGYNTIVPNQTLASAIWFMLGFFFSIISFVVVMFLPDKK